MVCGFFGSCLGEHVLEEEWGDEVVSRYKGVWMASGRFAGRGGDYLVNYTICCPQLAVATSMSFIILTHFDNVSVELSSWLCAVCVCEGVTVLFRVSVCVYAVTLCNNVLAFQVPRHPFLLSHLVLLVHCAKLTVSQLTHILYTHAHKYTNKYTQHSVFARK